MQNSLRDSILTVLTLACQFYHWHPQKANFYTKTFEVLETSKVTSNSYIEFA